MAEPTRIPPVVQPEKCLDGVTVSFAGGHFRLPLVAFFMMPRLAETNFISKVLSPFTPPPRFTEENISRSGRPSRAVLHFESPPSLVTARWTPPETD